MKWTHYKTFFIGATVGIWVAYIGLRFLTPDIAIESVFGMGIGASIGLIFVILSDL